MTQLFISPGGPALDDDDDGLDNVDGAELRLPNSSEATLFRILSPAATCAAEKSAASEIRPPLLAACRPEAEEEGEAAVAAVGPPSPTAFAPRPVATAAGTAAFAVAGTGAVERPRCLLTRSMEASMRALASGSSANSVASRSLHASGEETPASEEMRPSRLWVEKQQFLPLGDV